jgi:hypothetical protein
MNGMIRDTHFRLYEVREDGEGINLILYIVDLDAKNDYTIGTKENHIKEILKKKPHISGVFCLWDDM